MPIFGFKDTGFEVKTESLGPLNFHRVSPDYAARIEKADFQRDLPPDAFLSLLLVILGSKQDGRPILVEEAYGLSASEREAFVHAFLNEHGEYYRERISEERTTGAGEKTVRSYLGDRVVNPRHQDEEPAVYLARVYRDFASGIVTPETRKVMEPELPPAPPPPPAPPVAAEEHTDIFADSMLKNAALTESLGKSLAQMKMLETHGDERPHDIEPVEPAASFERVQPVTSFDRVQPAERVEPMDSFVLVEPPVSIEPPLPPPVPPQPPLPPLDLVVPDRGPPTMDLTPTFEEPSFMRTTNADTKQALELMQNAYTTVLQGLQDFAESAEQNARAARSARRVAVAALILTVLLSAVSIGYLTFRDGLWGRDFNRSLSEQNARAADQKQQIDTLKSVVDQLRAQRTPPARVPD